MAIISTQTINNNSVSSDHADKSNPDIGVPNWGKSIMVGKI